MDQDKTSSARRTERDVTSPPVPPRRVRAAPPPAPLFMEPVIPVKREPEPAPADISAPAPAPVSAENPDPPHPRAEPAKKVPAETAPAAESQVSEAPPAVATPVPDATPALPTQVELWFAVRERPQLIAAALALATVERYARTAREHADWLRRTYPRVDPDRLARIAVRRAAQRARLAAGTALVGGSLGATARLSALTWARARLVLDVAAIYGADPAHPERAVEILTLLRVHPDRTSAVRAVAAIIEPAPAIEGAGPEVTSTGRTGSAKPVLALGTRLVVWMAARLVPGAGLVLDGLRSATDIEDLARRTTRFYRDGAPRP